MQTTQSKYDQAAEELLEAIPGLVDMECLEACELIDEFVKTWKCPALSFNPYVYYTIARHNRMMRNESLRALTAQAQELGMGY